jgi:hypothetical protein
MHVYHGILVDLLVALQSHGNAWRQFSAPFPLVILIFAKDLQKLTNADQKNETDRGVLFGFAKGTSCFSFFFSENTKIFVDKNEIIRTLRASPI